MRAMLAVLTLTALIGPLSARAEDKLPAIINGPGAQTAPDEVQAAYARGRREQAEQDRKPVAEQPDTAVPGIVYGTGPVIGVVVGIPHRPAGPGGLNYEGVSRGGMSAGGLAQTGLSHKGVATGGVSTTGMGLGRVSSEGLSPGIAVPRNPRGPEAGLGLKGSGTR